MKVYRVRDELHGCWCVAGLWPSWSASSVGKVWTSKKNLRAAISLARKYGVVEAKPGRILRVYEYNLELVNNKELIMDFSP